MILDHDACYRAFASRDARFDGRVFVGVVTTGIYCRPICPARTPRPENVRFYASAAAAQGAGFRPCLRCRPESSPDLGAWLGTSASVSRALALIEAGALDEDDVEALAARLGMGGRQLRRLFRQHLGASPVAVAQTRRVLLAKQLLHETRLPIAEVALAAGFGSIRRFNETFQALFDRPPAALRRASAASGGEAASGDPLTLTLAFRPPLDWPALLAALVRRPDPAERIEQGRYHRRIILGGEEGEIAVSPLGEGRLRLAVRFPRFSALPAILARVRRRLDLAADPAAIGTHLARDPLLGALVARRPGLRAPGDWEQIDRTDRDADSFDAADPLLLTAWTRLGGAADRLDYRAAAWSPWRAYAAQHLIASLDDADQPEEQTDDRHAA